MVKVLAENWRSRAELGILLMILGGDLLHFWGGLLGDWDTFELVFHY